MLQTNIEKQILINADPNEICAKLADFRQWMSWSPWLVMEPDALVEFDDANKFYRWEGKRVGAGNMKMLGVEDNGSEKKVNYKIHFFKFG